MHTRPRILTLCGLALLIGLVLATGPAVADEPQTAPQPTPPSPMLHGELTLSLRDAIAMGVENNLDVEIDRYTPLIADEDARAAWGAYDPALFADLGYGSTQTPNSNPLAGGDPTIPAPTNLEIIQGRSVEGSGGVRGIVPKLGASYELGYEGSSTETSSAFPDLTPEYRTTVQAKATLPLMKGLLWNAPWVQVKITGLQRGAASEDFRRSLMDTVRDIENAYWGLVAAGEQRRVAGKSLETARALLEQVKAQYEVGVVSRVEVVEAEAGIAGRDFDLIGRENEYRASQDRLIDVVLGRNLRPTSRLELRPTDAPDPLPYHVDAEQAASNAFDHRPELEQARNAVEQQKIRAQFAKNQRLPQLDLVAGYSNSGLAGKVNDKEFFTTRIPGNIPRRYSGTDNDFFSSDKAQSWNAGAVFSIPIGNRTARADYRKAEFELNRSRTQLRRLEQDIILEVRGAIRNLQSAQQGIEAAERRRLAAAEQQRAERIRLEHGESTPFNVLERDEDLVEAESQKIFALQAYRNSIAALDRAQGTILETRNVVIDEARTLR